MAAYRKKYADLVENDKPVMLPPETDTPPKLDEPPKQSDPVGQAAKSAIVDRLRETERAQEFQREAPQPQQPPMADVPPQQQEPPPHVLKWVNEHPEYFGDPVGQAEINLAAMKAAQEGKTWDEPDYIPTIERHLGLRQPEQPPQPRAPAAPARPAGGPSVPYSAPPTRESPSMATGHPVSDSRVTLTAEEANLAKLWGLTNQEYAKQKQRLLREKAAGMHQNG